MGGQAGTSSMIRNYYLIQEIRTAENIRVRLNTRVVGGGGEGRLERLALQDSVSGRTASVGAAAVFILIGAQPRTEWLPKEVARDEKGIVLTGEDLLRSGRCPSGWYLERPPMALETSIAGVFVAGDVRHRSVKRVASAVGEGSIAVRFVHRHLADAGLQDV